MSRPQAMTWLVVSVLAMVLAVVSGLRSQSYARCQAAVNDALVAAQIGRDEAAAHDRQAVDRMVTDVLAARSPADTRAALERYRDTRAEADRNRAEHPLPAPPSQTCG